MEVSNLEVHQLQALVTKYPWFSYAREVLLCKMVEIEPQCLESIYKESLVFFPMRENVLLKARRLAACRQEPQATGESVASLLVVEESDALSANEVEPLEELSLQMDFDFSGGRPENAAGDFVLETVPSENLIQDDTAPLEVVQPVKPRIVVVGGDYFSKDDFAQLEESERAAEIKLGAPAEGGDAPGAALQGDDLDFDSLDFVTETLAKIYADQGYYDKAIEVYAKLILLYPEKSTYFATLVNEIKSKN